MKKMSTAQKIYIVVLSSPVWLLIIFMVAGNIYGEYFNEDHWRVEYYKAQEDMMVCEINFSDASFRQQTWSYHIPHYTADECKNIQNRADKWSMKLRNEPYEFDYKGNPRGDE
jgi:hypothetical protein